MRQIIDNNKGKTLLGKQIKNLRQLYNDAQYEMAARLKMSVSKLSQIERGVRQPKLEELKPLENAYPVKVVKNELTGEITLEKE